MFGERYTLPTCKHSLSLLLNTKQYPDTIELCVTKSGDFTVTLVGFFTLSFSLDK